MTAEEVIGKVAKLCERYHVQEAILFGSRAKGTATDRSLISQCQARKTSTLF